jgi:diguanylate cyclase (GGDEF)-like protein
MATRDVLVVGTILLCCACLGLVIARLGSRGLKGLGWLAGAFTAGALGVAVILALHSAPVPYRIVADTLLLLAYVSLHVSILEITGSDSLIPRLGLILLGIQAAFYPVFQWVHLTEPLALVTLGVVLAIQALQTAAYLKNHMKEGMVACISLTIALLVGFAAFNVVRSMVLLNVRLPSDPLAPYPLELASGIVFLVAAMGLGFSVFWMTGMQLRLDLERLASTDPLTGLHNRRAFLTHCEKELTRTSRGTEPFSLVLLDLDYFKEVNDRHGHEAGDAALCAVASHLRGAVRENDVLARWGGEEFIVLLPGTSGEQAVQVAQRLRLCIESISLLHNGRVDAWSTIRLAMSAGVVTTAGAIESMDTLLRTCDEALYCAKAAGRNTVVHRELRAEVELSLTPSLTSMTGTSQSALPAAN